MEELVPETRWEIAGINHQAWLLKVQDGRGNDLYPEIKRRAAAFLSGEAVYDGDWDNLAIT